MNKWKIIENKLDEKIIKSYDVQKLSECISVLEEIKKQYGDINICRMITINPKLYIDVHKMGEQNVVLIN